MATLTAPQPSRNPFRSNPQTPNITGSSSRSAPVHEDPFNNSAERSRSVPASPPPAFSDAPPVTVTAPPPTDNSSRDREREMRSVLEEPPPYSITPSVREGETTLELGPSRPFQQAPLPAHLARPPVQSWVPQTPPIQQPMRTGSTTPSLGNRTGSLFRQLSQSLDNVVNNLNSMGSSSNSGFTTHPTGQSTWSSYPGHQQHHTPPPPRQPYSFSPPAGATTEPRIFCASSSDFARDFYAAGTGDGAPVPPPRPPPSGAPRPPPRTDASTAPSNHSVPNDGRPTSHPVIGHPLLKDGKVLVYPKGHECEKCHNVGYKDSDPQRPCKRCWGKYAKAFTGPLAYSFSPESLDPSNNFQRPLSRIPLPPPPPPPPPPPQPSYPPNPAPHRFAPGGYMPNNNGGFYNPPNRFPPTTTHPPPGSVVYSAGDPRIGGRLCFNCHGKGNVSFLLLERVTCEVCGGIGRTFR
ncbi:hypothetical protein NLJ89_g7774 [Agrocybe chaxingu]|uniref:Uncharacterized protein n=1 Tax=Agrocybe chaxingu TaxID=84603 RepID=A0A9W8MV49_9AGAR|nr:hypothetical protein NLJ89_g7774 [Agrocybe chaxingu]